MGVKMRRILCLGALLITGNVIAGNAGFNIHNETDIDLIVETECHTNGDSSRHCRETVWSGQTKHLTTPCKKKVSFVAFPDNDKQVLDKFRFIRFNESLTPKCGKSYDWNINHTERLGHPTWYN
jgi:hypothetical protein